jgi:hypothetical protein
MQLAIANTIDHALDTVYGFFIDLFESRTATKRDKALGWKGPFTGK